MGEIEKILGNIIFCDNASGHLTIELNQGNVVHLQSDSWRIELTIDEFKRFSDVVITASKKLKKIKGLD